MKIVKQKVTQIALVQHNQIPFVRLLNKKFFDILANKYGFANGTPIQDASGMLIGVAFGIGLFENAEKKDLPILQLSIEDRRVILEIEGNSRSGFEFYDSLRTFLASIAESSDKDFMKPIVIAEDSEMIVHLDISAESLLSSDLFNFVQTDVLAEASKQFPGLSETSVDTITVNFQINYRPMEKLLDERRIVLNRKDFIIQSAIGYPLSEKMYLSKAPVNTEIHEKLMKNLEIALMTKKRN